MLNDFHNIYEVLLCKCREDPAAMILLAVMIS